MDQVRILIIARPNFVAKLYIIVPVKENKKNENSSYIPPRPSTKPDLLHKLYTKSVYQKDNN